MGEDSERFVRWQGQTMAQMSVVLGLFGTLSLGGIGLCFSLVQQDSFNPSGCYATAFLLALFSLLVASVSSIVATVTRLLDFRLTAQKLRHRELDRTPTYFGAGAIWYGKATWFFLWCTAISLILAVALLTAVVSKVYLGEVVRATGL